MTPLVLALVLFLWLLVRAADEPSVLVLGSPGSGKSYAAAADAVRWPGALVVLDPHVRSLAELCLLHLPEEEVLFDRLDDLDHSLGYTLLEPADPGAWPSDAKRAQENRRRVQTFLEILLRRRGADSITGSPLIEEWLAAGLSLWMYGSRKWPLWWLPFAFQPATSEFRAMTRECLLPQIRVKFDALEELKSKPRGLRQEIGPVLRLVDAVFSDPSFRLRSRGGFDLAKFLAGGGKLLLEGGEDIDAEAKRVLLCGVGTLAKDYCRRRPVPFPPVRVYRDECVNAGLLSPKELRSIAEMRKYGQSDYLISQLLNHPGDPNEWLELCNRHEVFFTPHREMARSMAVEMEPVWPDDGKTRAERIDDLTKAIMRQRPGQRHVKDRGMAWAETLDMLDDNLPDWPGLKDEIIQEKLAWIYQRAEYRIGSDDDTTSPPTSPPDTPPPTSSPGSSSAADRLNRNRRGGKSTGG